MAKCNFLSRLLQASIEKDSLEDPMAKGRLLSHWDKAQLQQIASHCNVKKLAAKMASTQSDDLFFARWTTYQLTTYITFTSFKCTNDFKSNGT